MKRGKVTTEKLAEALEISDRLLYDYQRPIPPASLGPGEPDSSKKAKTAPKRPTKKTVVTMALLMHLMPDWSRHLLNQASYVLDPSQREELAWLCAIQTCYMCEIEQINLQFRQLGLTALTSRFPEDSAA